MFRTILCSVVAGLGLLSIATGKKSDLGSGGVMPSTNNYDIYKVIQGEDAIEYAKDYGFSNYEDVLEVFIVNDVKVEMPKEHGTYFFGNDYYIVSDSIKTSYLKGDLIGYNEYYGAGSATMTVTTTLESQFSYDFEIGPDELRVKLGYTRKTTFSISNSYTFTIKDDDPTAVACFANLERKDYTVYEDDLFFDDYVGEFYSTRPIGCTFISYKI